MVLARLTSVVLFLLALTILPAACGSSSSSSTVNMSNLQFSPSSLTVTVGTKVTWKNKDGIIHDITSNTGVFASGNINAGGSFSYTFKTAGTYAYNCLHHPGMNGTIIVQN